MGQLYAEHLEGRTYRCRRCRTHLAKADELVSTAFHCRYGRAYLFNTVTNVNNGPREERLMTTGLHTVLDIACTQCSTVVGWKYEEAFEKTQRYKEGKFILEKCGGRKRAANTLRSLIRTATRDRAKLVDEDGNELSDTDAD